MLLVENHAQILRLSQYMSKDIYSVFWDFCPFQTVTQVLEAATVKGLQITFPSPSSYLPSLPFGLL